MVGGNIVRFVVGQKYYSTEFRYNSKDEIVKKKKYWLCVKRNESTGYVSFKEIYEHSISSSLDSRKAEVVWRESSPSVNLSVSATAVLEHGETITTSMQTSSKGIK